MTWTVSYLIPWLLGFVIVGAAVHIADRRWGVPLYRWWYNRSRKTPIPENEEMGFIYRRSRRRQRYATYIISGLQSTYMVWSKGVDPMFELVAFVFEAEIMIIGLWVGHKFYKYIEMRDKLDARLDNQEGIETARISFAGVQNYFSGLVVRAFGWGKVEGVKPVTPIETPPANDLSLETQMKAETPDPRDALDRYTRGGRR